MYKTPPSSMHGSRGSKSSEDSRSVSHSKSCHENSPTSFSRITSTEFTDSKGGKSQYSQNLAEGYASPTVVPRDSEACEPSVGGDSKRYVGVIDDSLLSEVTMPTDKPTSDRPETYPQLGESYYDESTMEGKSRSSIFPRFRPSHMSDKEGTSDQASALFADSETKSELGSLFLTRSSGKGSMWKAYRQSSGKDNIIKIIRTNQQEGEASGREVTNCSQTDSRVSPDHRKQHGQPNNSMIDGRAVGQTTNNNLEILKSRSESSALHEEGQDKRLAGVQSYHDTNRSNETKQLDQRCKGRKTRGELLRIKQQEIAALNQDPNVDSIPSWLRKRGGLSIDNLVFQNLLKESLKEGNEENKEANVSRQKRKNRYSDGDESSVNGRTSRSSGVSLRLIDHLQLQEPEHGEGDRSKFAPGDDRSTSPRRFLQRSGIGDHAEDDEYGEKEEFGCGQVLNSSDYNIADTPSHSHGSTSKKDGVSFKETRPEQSHHQYNDNKCMRVERSNLCNFPTKMCSKAIQVDIPSMQSKVTRDSFSQYSPPYSPPANRFSDEESVSTQASTICSHCRYVNNSNNPGYSFHDHKPPKRVGALAKCLSRSNTTLSEYVSDRGYTLWHSDQDFRPSTDKNPSTGIVDDESESVISCTTSSSSTKYEDANTSCRHNRRSRRMFRKDSPPPVTNYRYRSHESLERVARNEDGRDRLERSPRGSSLKLTNPRLQETPSSNRNSNHPSLVSDMNLTGNNVVDTNSHIVVRNNELPALPITSTGTVTSMQQLQEIVENAKMKTHSSSANNNMMNGYEAAPDEESIETTSIFIGEYLYSLWKHQCLCDVSVTIDGSTFRAHKLVLAAFSDIFCPTSPQPVPSVSFEVPDSTPDAVYQIFRYLYTSTMELKDDMLEPIMSAALFMGICEIVDIVKEILSRPTLSNMDMYAGIKRNFGLMPDLRDYVGMLENHFMEMIETKCYLQLDLEDIEKILQDPDVLVESEMDTMKAIANWVEYNPMCRMDKVPKLLRLVNFECIPPEDIAVLTDEYSHLLDCTEARNIIAGAYRFHALKHVPGTEQFMYDKLNVPLPGRKVSREPNDLKSNTFNATRKDFIERRISGNTSIKGLPTPGFDAMFQQPSGAQPYPSQQSVRRGIGGSSRYRPDERLKNVSENHPRHGKRVHRDTRAQPTSYKSTRAEHTCSRRARTSQRTDQDYGGPSKNSNSGTWRRDRRISFNDDDDTIEDDEETSSQKHDQYCQNRNGDSSIDDENFSASYNHGSGSARDRNHRSQERSHVSERKDAKVTKIRGYAPSTRTKVVTFQNSPTDFVHSNNNALPAAASKGSKVKEIPCSNDQTSYLVKRTAMGPNDKPDVREPRVLNSAVSISRHGYKVKFKREVNPSERDKSKKVFAQWTPERDLSDEFHVNESRRRSAPCQNAETDTDGDDKNGNHYHQNTRNVLIHDEKTSAFSRYEHFGGGKRSEQRRRSHNDSLSSDWERLSENMSFFSPESADRSYDVSFDEHDENNSHNDVVSGSYDSIIFSTHLTDNNCDQNTVLNFDPCNQMTANCNPNEDFTTYFVPIDNKVQTLNQLSREDIEELLSDISSCSVPNATNMEASVHDNGWKLLGQTAAKSRSNDSERIIVNCSDDYKLGRDSNTTVQCTDLQPGVPRCDVGVDEFDCFVQQRIMHSEEEAHK